MANDDLTPARITTDRLTMNVWQRGPEDGTPVLLVHGNLSTGGFYRYVAAELPDDVRVMAPDLRGFGDTDPEPVDATRGLGDMVDDLRALLQHLGLAGTGAVHAAGWSMGAGVLQQYQVTHPDDLASLTLIAPLSPYGFGGTKGADGQLCFPDAAGSGAGGANPAFVQALAARDTSDTEGSPRQVMRQFYGPGANAENVDEDFLTDELVKTRTGDDFYPGDGVASPNWPMLAPGTRGVLNTMAPNHYNSTAIVDVPRKPPICWMRGTADLIVSDRSMFDLATLGELGAVPGWPGADVIPPQPMVQQTRAVLADYAANGGHVEEVELGGIGHGIPLEVPRKVAEEIIRHVRTGG